MKDGLLRGEPNVITQTPDGYIWIGTTGGLMQFDGVRLAPWKPPDGSQLPSPNARALLAGRDGSLWIGPDAGLSHWTHGGMRLGIYRTRPQEYTDAFQEGPESKPLFKPEADAEDRVDFAIRSPIGRRCYSNTRLHYDTQAARVLAEGLQMRRDPGTTDCSQTGTARAMNSN